MSDSRLVKCGESIIGAIFAFLDTQVTVRSCLIAMVLMAMGVLLASLFGPW